MANLRDTLKKRLEGQKPAGALPGAGHKALEDRLRGQAGAQEKAQRAALYAPVDVYLVTDATGSMEYLISTVRDGAEKIGRELFNNPDKGAIRMGISAVRDHGEGAALFEQGVLRSTLDSLRQDITAIRCYGGGDGSEAYECAWLELARIIPQTSGERKKVVVFAGDNLPHGYKPNLQARSTLYIDDNGCPNQVDYRVSWRALTTAADLTLFVGCHKDFSQVGMTEAQQSIVEHGNPNQKYIPLDHVEDIPALILGATRLVQSSTAAKEYIARLTLEDAGKAHRVKGYLGVKNGS